MPGLSKEEQLARPEREDSGVDEAEEYRICVARATHRGRILCDWCGREIRRERDIERHHVVPRSRGGETHRRNLACVHGPWTPERCHTRIHEAGAPGWDAFHTRYEEAA